MLSFSSGQSSEFYRAILHREKSPFAPPSSRLRLVDLYFRHIEVQIFLDIQFILMLATYVTLPVCFALTTLRAIRTFKLRLLSALPMLMALQRVFPPVRTAASGAGESTERRVDIVPSFRYLQLGERHYYIFLRLHWQIYGFLPQQVDHASVFLCCTCKREKKQLQVSSTILGETPCRNRTCSSSISPGIFIRNLWGAYS